MRLATARSRLVLRSLEPAEAAGLYALVQANIRHLTQHGDYRDAARTTVDGWLDELATRRPEHNFGVYERGRLVGRVELVPVEPPRYGLGYWLAEHACGRGNATLAVAAIVRHARHGLHATDIFAGITHGNDRSVAVLNRLGFRRSAGFDTYDRYHLPLRPEPG